MNLFDIYNKLQQVRDFLSGPGADTVDRFAELSQKVTDAAKDIAKYLHSLDNTPNLSLATPQNVQAVEGLKQIKADCDKMVEGHQNRVGAIPPGLALLLATVVSKLIEKLLEKLDKQEQPA